MEKNWGDTPSATLIITLSRDSTQNKEYICHPVCFPSVVCPFDDNIR